MTELDQVWSQMLVDAGRKASEVGRNDVAEYLRLKASNDAIRAAGVGWLLDAVIEVAGREMRDRPGLAIEREEPHSFSRGNSRMVGTLLRVRYGVRCMTVEAGWVRTPSDGIMRQKALAAGRISHFGRSKDDVELMFLHVDSIPQWVDQNGSLVSLYAIGKHFEKLVTA